jgi:hypothetical protein
MQLEELRQQWTQLDRKLDRSLALETELVRRVVMQPVRGRINRLAIWPVIDVIFCVGVLLVCGEFLGTHWRDWHLAVPAGVLMIGAIALMVDSIFQLQRVAELDWCKPVADIQCALESLRVSKIRQFKWIILFSPLVGFCGLMVGLNVLIDRLPKERVDLLDKLDSGWIVANYVFGALFVPLGYFVARVLAGRCHGHQWWKAVLDDISGRSLNAAVLEVKRWASLHQEESQVADQT